MMKLLIVTSLKEYRNDVFKIFKESGIGVFSTTDITGIKEGPPSDMMEDWFASGDESYNSVVVFSFTKADSANHAVELIENYNRRQTIKFPLRAFVMPVEKSIG